MIDLFRKQEVLNPMTIESYQGVLSEKTRVLMQLEQWKRISEAQQQRKQELILAIQEGSKQLDGIDSDSELVKADIAQKERELQELEASLSTEQKQVYKQAESILSDKTAKAAKFNALINEAFAIWKELSTELSQTEALILRTAFDVSKPVDLQMTFDFDWSSLPEFGKYPDSHQIQAVTRYQGHQHKL